MSKKISINPAKRQKSDNDKGLMMLNLISTAINTSRLMAIISGQADLLYSSIVIAIGEYIVEESDNINVKTEVFLKRFVKDLEESVTDHVKLQKEEDF